MKVYKKENIENMKKETMIEINYEGKFKGKLKITWKQIKEAMPYLLFFGMNQHDLSEFILPFING